MRTALGPFGGARGHFGTAAVVTPRIAAMASGSEPEDADDEAADFEDDEESYDEPPRTAGQQRRRGCPLPQVHATPSLRFPARCSHLPRTSSMANAHVRTPSSRLRPLD